MLSMASYFMFPIAGTIVGAVMGAESTKNSSVASSENVTDTMNKIFAQRYDIGFLQSQNFFHTSTCDPFYIAIEKGKKVLHYWDTKASKPTSIEFDNPSFFPMASKIVQSPFVVTLADLVHGFCNSVYIDKEKKKKMEFLLNRYVGHANMDISARFIKKVINPFRFFERAPSQEELDYYVREYNDNKDDTSLWKGLSDSFTFNREEKEKYRLLKEDLDELSEVLFDACDEAKKKQQEFSATITSELKNYKGNKLTRDILLLATNNVLYQEALYSFYKETDDLNLALEEFVRNQVKNGLLFYKQPSTQKGGMPNIVCDNNNIVSIDDDYVEEQVYRFFKLGTLKQTQDKSLMVDMDNGYVVFNDEGRGVCVFDMKNLSKDLENPCYFAVISRMLEKMTTIANNLNLNAKTVDESDRLITFLSELYEKIKFINEEDNEIEKEALSLSIMHYVKKISFLDVSSRLDVKQRPSINVTSLKLKDKDGEEYTNYMYDITDPVANTSQTCTILRKGEKIFFKMDPGTEGIEEITLDNLLTMLPKADDLCKEGKDAVYIGDVWPMREMIYELQNIQKEKKLQEEIGWDFYDNISTKIDDISEKANNNDLINLSSLNTGIIR